MRQIPRGGMPHCLNVLPLTQVRFTSLLVRLVSVLLYSQTRNRTATHAGSWYSANGGWTKLQLFLYSPCGRNNLRANFRQATLQLDRQSRRNEHTRRWIYISAPNQGMQSYHCSVCLNNFFDQLTLKCSFPGQSCWLFLFWAHGCVGI